MNQDLKNLLRIQEFDRRVAYLEEELQKIDQKEEKILEVISIKEDQIRSAKEEKEEIEKDKAFKEELLNDVIENLKKLETKLNSATTEKQMQAVNIEIDIAKTNKNVLEEKIVSLEESIEEKEKDIKELEDRYAQLQKTLADHKVKFDARRKEINEEIEKIKAEKESLLDTIKPELLKKYERLNRWTKGTSIVPVKQGACYGCFMKVTPQILATLEETEEIVYCPNCGRMLYKEDKETSSENS